MLRLFCLFDGATAPAEMNLQHIAIPAKKGPATMGCQYGRREAGTRFRSATRTQGFEVVKEGRITQQFSGHPGDPCGVQMVDIVEVVYVVIQEILIEVKERNAELRADLRRIREPDRIIDGLIDRGLYTDQPDPMRRA